MVVTALSVLVASEIGSVVNWEVILDTSVVVEGDFEVVSCVLGTTIGVTVVCVILVVSVAGMDVGCGSMVVFVVYGVDECAGRTVSALVATESAGREVTLGAEMVVWADSASIVVWLV